MRDPIYEDLPSMRRRNRSGLGNVVHYATPVVAGAGGLAVVALGFLVASGMCTRFTNDSRVRGLVRSELIATGDLEENTSNWALYYGIGRDSACPTDENYVDVERATLLKSGEELGSFCIGYTLAGDQPWLFERGLLPEGRRDPEILRRL
ncbi:hypothetical protein HOD38_03975 [archaeon]|jgi:hypothetical protein|nr:hypothetical protein [archaeon]MBT4397400.1 hypothetical protein [archaeon]MBT4440472.1 hypothetical protein [archaeon]